MVEEPPGPARRGGSRGVPTAAVIPFSAATPEALDALCLETARVQHGQRDPVSAVAATVRRGRRPLPFRRSVVVPVGGSLEEAVRAGAGRRPPRVAGDGAVVLLFPGQGSQFPGMGHQLHRHSRVYRAALDDVLGLCEPGLRCDLADVLGAGRAEVDDARRRALLDDTSVTQPALFAVGYASARAVAGVGVEPTALLGHSIGEFAAAVTAGVMSLPDGVGLVSARGRLLADTTPGAMAAVSTGPGPAAELADRAGVSVAAVNSPGQTVLSGSVEGIDRVVEAAGRSGIRAVRLRVGRAFHSVLVEPAVRAMEELVSAVPLAAPAIPMASAATGGWWSDAEATSPGAWARQLRDPVRFADALATISAAYPEPSWVEAGPGTALGAAARACGYSSPAISVLGRPDDHDDDDGAAEARLVGRLWEIGVGSGRLAGSGYLGSDDEPRAVVPTYPFRRQPYRFVDLAGPGAVAPRPAIGAEYVTPRDEVEELVTSTVADVLGISGVGAEDEFFSLGGDSLAATVVATKLSEQTGLDVGVGHVIEPPSTPSNIAAALRRLAEVAVAALSDDEVQRLLTAD